MKVLVDTGVWSLAFRRKKLAVDGRAIVQQLQTLILDGDACMTGVIRQEILSGIKHPQQYDKLKEKLRAFDDLTVTQQDHELAAAMFNTCRSKGVQGSHIDFLICAIAHHAEVPIFAVDGDFGQYAPYLPITLYPGEADLNRIHDTQAQYNLTPFFS
jgi:predicted nucleic acid-binding protein